MGLISRVSSRTYRKPQKKYQKTNFEHGPLHHQQTPKEKQPAGFRHREQRRSDPSRNPKRCRCRHQRTTYAASRCCRQRNRCWRTKRFDLDGPSSTNCWLAKTTNKTDQSAEVSNTSTKLSWKIAFSQLKSLVRGSDTKWTILPSSKLSWTDPARPTLSTKPPPSPPSTNDSPERTLFLNFQNTNSKLFFSFLF